jgi:DNA-directed RNA polymerase subunit H (RpoH/RPB5)
MSEAQYNQYNNIVTFATEWRKYKLVDKVLSQDNFRKSMQSDEYVKLECLDMKKNKTILIYLFDKSSKYTATSAELKKLLNKIKISCNVILIVYKPLGVYGRRVIQKFKSLNVFVYLHEIFDLVIPNGPLCYPHRVMSREEVLRLTNDDLCCYLTNLPKILDEDSQCIWIGAEIGDVVEITMLGDSAGETIQYRVVIPKSGKVIAYKDISDENKEAFDESAAAEENLDELDDEIQEHRDNKVENEDEDISDNEPTEEVDETDE